MLSIRFAPDKEWWVSGKVFERLFQAALERGKMPAKLERWQHVADANGGFDVSSIERSEAEQLTAALRSTAEAELDLVRTASLNSEDGTYRVSLLKLLQIASLD
jgi:hypothetical protein